MDRRVAPGQALVQAPSGERVSEAEIEIIENQRGRPPTPLSTEEFVSIAVFHCGECHDYRERSDESRNSNLEGIGYIYSPLALLEQGQLLYGDGQNSPLIRRMVSGNMPPPFSSSVPVPPATIALMSNWVNSLSFSPCQFKLCGDVCQMCPPNEESCETSAQAQCNGSGECRQEPLDYCTSDPLASSCRQNFPSDRFVLTEDIESTCLRLFYSSSSPSCHAELYLGADTIQCIAASEGFVKKEGAINIELVSANLDSTSLRAYFKVGATVSSPLDRSAVENREFLIDALTGAVRRSYIP